MPLHVRRLIGFGAFVAALVVGAWLKYGLETGWTTAIVAGVLIFLVLPFVISRYWALHIIRRMERAAQDKAL